MNIELDEVVVLDVSDEALELAAGSEGDVRIGASCLTLFTCNAYGKCTC